MLIHAQTPLVMQRILKSEFDIDLRVEVVNSEAAQDSVTQHQRTVLEQADKQIQSALRTYGQSSAPRNTPAEDKPKETILPRVGSLFSLPPDSMARRKPRILSRGKSKRRTENTTLAL